MPRRLPGSRFRLFEKSSLPEAAAHLLATTALAFASAQQTIPTERARESRAVRAGLVSFRSPASCAHGTRARTKAAGLRNSYPERRLRSTADSLRPEFANCPGCLCMCEGIFSRRRDRHQERPLSYQFHLSRRRLDNYRAIPVFGLEFLPGRQPRGLPNCFWDYHSPGRINGSSHAIILPFPRPRAEKGATRGARADEGVRPLLLID